MTGRDVHDGGARRLVLIAYYFPPLAGIASERSAAFTRHLPERGWEPVVIAPRRGMYHGGDSVSEGLESMVVRTRNPEISRGLRGGWSTATGGAVGAGERELRSAASGPMGRRLRRLVREALYVPDARWPWIPFAARAARRAAASGGPAVVMSTSVPYSAHVAGGRAARAAGVPWVAEFRDPWSAAERGEHPPSRLRRALDRWMEERFLRNADRVVVTAEATRSLLLDAFPRIAPEKIAVVPNGFEPLAGDAPRPPDPREPLLLTYTGTINDPNHVVPVVRGVDRLADRQPGSVRVRVFGPGAPWREACSRASLQAPPWLELRGVVSVGEARAAAHEASALLLPLPDERYRMIIPGKLWEYLGARRPVVVAHPRGTETEALLDAYGDGRWIEPFTAERVDSVVAVLLEEHRAGRLQAPVVAPERVAGLTRAARTEALAGLLDTVVAEAGG